ncbi:MAG: bifunctional diaminohydroxyphosphoribosylaminopyrimidine deaminase/5-amino-6-(5-phosphoribosylamino)uracil reductase RibD [Acidobacteriota bacterium]|nr:bifunctional diaminohydroxyphosphoribosylaminopyrimidine deaminase/5-amino-6-(5-phosphoribosylamino)uracil reductase RibD [Acidobacteriota bacterium]
MDQQVSKIDFGMTRRALALAAVAIGQVSPNPLVGCIIVSEAGELVGEGTYVYDNVLHAETIALNQAGVRAKGGTAYVSLEPHSHYGKTPPCTDALINAGITRVVCPIEDPNPLVSGKGFEQLRSNGIEVVTGILADEAAKQNEKFICWHRKKRPFVHLKLAMSLDGRISLKNSISTALSNEAALKHVHDLRHEYDAILIGGNTAFVDNPSLTDRSGKLRRRKLVRIVLDNRLQIPVGSPLVFKANETPTLVFTNSKDLKKIEELHAKGVEVIEPEQGGRNLDVILAQLAERQIQSVLVEGGMGVAGAFCDAKLVDKFTFMIAPLVIGGCEAPSAIGGKGAETLNDAINLSDIQIVRHGSDIEITGYPNTAAANE